MYEPSPATVYVVGAEAVQPAAPAEGGVDDSVTRYPATVTSSEAVKAVIGTARLVEGEVTRGGRKAHELDTHAQLHMRDTAEPR